MSPSADPLERRARAHRLLLEAEVRLQSGAERDEEAIVPLAADLLRDVLGATRRSSATRLIPPSWPTASAKCACAGATVTDRAPPGRACVGAIPLMLDGDVAAQTARNGEARLVQQVTSPAHDGAGRASDTFSILSVPICADALLLGVLNAYRPATLPFDDEDMASALIFAGGVAVALLNARLNARLMETEARARALVERSPDTILVHTIEGRIMEANTAAGELLGGPIRSRLSVLP